MVRGKPTQLVSHQRLHVSQRSRFNGSYLSCTSCAEFQYQATVKLHGSLSVLSRVTCIFTGTMISPSLSLRQCPNRYAFRAGRNLPDKEFRYLRTVIVTAAVYWGSFAEANHSLNLPAPGRRQPLYITLRFSRDLCFDKQSRLFTAALLGVNPKEHPFSRSYGVILPSSLTRVRSLTLEFSS